MGDERVLVMRAHGMLPEPCLFRVGDWAVHRSVSDHGAPTKPMGEHCCGGDLRGYTVTHEPRGLALIQHLPLQEAAERLAREAHQVCPPGQYYQTVLETLRGLVATWPRWAGQ